MNRTILSAVIIMSIATSAAALDRNALIGNWQLVENAMDRNGKPCPFVGQQIEFTSDGTMKSANMQMPFKYMVNPAASVTEAAIANNPELKGMEIMLAMVGNAKSDWSKAPIVYGVKLKDHQLTMKVSGYTPARYRKQK